MTEEQELAERLNEVPASNQVARTRDEPPNPNQPPPPRGDFVLWQALPNGSFRPGAQTRAILPSGVFRIGRDDLGLFFSKLRVINDAIIDLPDGSHDRVLSGIRKFWASKKRYETHGLVYKRGVLLWGPPGGGKTITVAILVQEIVKSHNGVVLICEHPELTVFAMRTLRAIEPTRPLIVVLEDVDEIIHQYGEHALLAMLDGEYQTGNVVYVATTNYPERLGARIINRPARFDERVKIGMPSAAARMAYLKSAVGRKKLPLEQWCADTEGFSIAHLRELVVAVICLEQEYSTVVMRLKAMTSRPKEEAGFRKDRLGFDAA